MHSVRTGSGKPLLLIHGISNLHNWDPIVPALARERTVIAVDPVSYTHLTLPTTPYV